MVKISNLYPTADFTGSASFDYTIDDGTGRLATANVTFSVTPFNEAPVLTGDLAAGSAKAATS